MLELPAQTYPVTHAGLNFVLERALALPRHSCLYLSGENGAGKSTFLEHVLIPSLRTKHSLLYLAQDMDLQQNTIRTTLALLGHDVPESLADMATAWVEASGCREIIILDEFDKYVSNEQLQALNLPGFKWVVQVSHLPRRERCTEFSHGFELAFDRQEGAVVNLRLTQLWPR
jgi:KaiC/GvpD/RAD55 family RecA-like ATPase